MPVNQNSPKVIISINLRPIERTGATSAINSVYIQGSDKILIKT